MQTNNDRARQFLSFDALKGLKEALKQKELVYVQKEDIIIDKDLLDETFNELKVDDMVKVTYKNNDKYIIKTGILVKVDINAKYIKVVKEKIFIDDIVNIEIV